jgi:hypothetical protein
MKPITIFFQWADGHTQKDYTITGHLVPRVDDYVELPDYAGTVREVHWVVDKKRVQCATVFLR